MSSPSQNFPTEPLPLAAPAPADGADWKQEVNERLAAHRTRRGRVAGAQTTLPLDVENSAQEPSHEQPAAQPVRSRARVAARVAERYSKAPTYSEVLAQRAEAQAPEPGRIETGKINSGQISNPGVVEADSQAILTGFLSAFEVADEQTGREVHKPVNAAPVVGYTQGDAVSSAAPMGAAGEALSAADAGEPADPSSSGRSSSGVEAGVEEWIPGNLIEFPRVLVAARKARPRLAEGPLRQDATVDSDPEHSQLRIFEVEQQAISTTAKVDPVATEWSSIRLDALPREVRNPDAQLQHSQRREAARSYIDAPLIEMQLQTAPLSDRLMAGLVDGALVALAFLGFVAVFVACTTHPPTGKPVLIASACTFAAFFVIYQYLFFTYSEGTPGMRYAHIALCTFDDENPTRNQMQRRIGALLLSACPLALGFAWAWFDQDRLGWHDRMSKTYQRSYR